VRFNENTEDDFLDEMIENSLESPGFYNGNSFTSNDSMTFRLHSPRDLSTDAFQKAVDFIAVDDIADQNFDSALFYLDISIGLDSSYFDPQLIMIAMLTEVGRYKESLKRINQFAKDFELIFETIPSLKIKKGLLSEKLGDEKTAFKVYNEVYAKTLDLLDDQGYNKEEFQDFVLSAILLSKKESVLDKLNEVEKEVDKMQIDSLVKNFDRKTFVDDFGTRRQFFFLE
jgi:hypothetical protein